MEGVWRVYGELEGVWRVEGGRVGECAESGRVCGGWEGVKRVGGCVEEERHVRRAQVRSQFV